MINLKSIILVFAVALSLYSCTQKTINNIVDLGQRGVAGINSFGAKPLVQYHLALDKTFRYGFTLVPVKAMNAEELSKISKNIG